MRVVLRFWNCTPLPYLFKVTNCLDLAKDRMPQVIHGIEVIRKVTDTPRFLCRVQQCRVTKPLTWRSKTMLQGSTISITTSSSHRRHQYLQTGSKPAAKVSVRWGNGQSDASLLGMLSCFSDQAFGTTKK